MVVFIYYLTNKKNNLFGSTFHNFVKKRWIRRGAERALSFAKSPTVAPLIASLVALEPWFSA